MSKAKKENEIQPQVEITCSADRRCCGVDAGCSGQFRVINGQLVFDRCGC